MLYLNTLQFICILYVRKHSWPIIDNKCISNVGIDVLNPQIQTFLEFRDPQIDVQTKMTTSRNSDFIKLRSLKSLNVINHMRTHKNINLDVRK